jgi:F0F1-type ATP synthase epsilon subunit
MSDEAKPAEGVAGTGAIGQANAKSDKSESDATTMQVKVHSPFKVYYEGVASSISAESATGPFDILPEHHNFITLLVPCDLVIRNGKNEEVVAISGGIMHVKADDVIVFLDV